MMTIKAGLLASMALTPVAFAGELEVIYGEDNRRDIHSADNDPGMVEVARSTAMLTYASRLTPDANAPGFSRLPGATYGASYNLCESEAFRSQPNPGFCSGFLVGEDILVTAGHCVETQSSCDSTAFVFGFGYQAADKDVTKVADLDVYRCKTLLAQALDRGSQTDYAVVQLDRKVIGRAPLKFRKEGRIDVGTPLTVIGHPAGLPTKISGGAKVRNSDPNAYFVANLDTYGGNSGSAVFNSSTYEVEGILVRGETDFTTRGSCRVSYTCTDDGCRGEDVTRATEFAPFVVDPNVPPRQTRSYEHRLTALQLPIPDNDRTGISQDIVVTEEGVLGDVELHVQLTHTYIGDLVIQLVHPDGTTVTVHNGEGGSADDLDQVWTSGEGGRRVLDLQKLRNKPAQGTWKLVVKDTASSDTGVLQAVNLTTKVFID